MNREELKQKLLWDDNNIIAFRDNVSKFYLNCYRVVFGN